MKARRREGLAKDYLFCRSWLTLFVALGGCGLADGLALGKGSRPLPKGQREGASLWALGWSRVGGATRRSLELERAGVVPLAAGDLARICVSSRRCATSCELAEVPATPVSQRSREEAASIQPHAFFLAPFGSGREPLPRSKPISKSRSRPQRRSPSATNGRPKSPSRALRAFAPSCEAVSYTHLTLPTSDLV